MTKINSNIDNKLYQANIMKILKGANKQKDNKPSSHNKFNTYVFI